MRLSQMTPAQVADIAAAADRAAAVVRRAGLAVYEPTDADLALPAEELARRIEERTRATLRRAWDHADWRPRATDIPTKEKP